MLTPSKTLPDAQQAPTIQSADSVPFTFDPIQLTTAMNSENMMGYERMIDALKSGESLFLVQAGFANNRARNDSLEMWKGAVFMVVESYCSALEKGIWITSSDATYQRFFDSRKFSIYAQLLAYLRAGDFANFSRFFAQLCDVVENISKKATFNFASGLSFQSAKMTDKPIRVEIVATPDYVAEQTVSHDPETLEIDRTVTRATYQRNCA